MSNKAYCPVPECDYWIAFGGYFEPFIKSLLKHYGSHKELPYMQRRNPGGDLDQIMGEAIVARLQVAPAGEEVG